MKSILKILPLLLLPFCATAQRADTTWLTATEVSLLSQIEKETEQIRIVELTEELLTLSDAKSTVPLLEEAKKMYGIAKRKKSLYLVIELEDVHLAQVLNYLKAYKLEVGLLINFGSKRLTFKRLVL